MNIVKQIRRIVVPCSATNLTLKKVKGLGHGMVPIERACHKDHACQISMLYKTSEDMSQVKVFVTDGQRDGQTDE